MLCILLCVAGLMAAYAGACWVQLLISSPHRLLAGVAAPAVGAAVAAALWRQLRSWQQQQGWSLTSAGLKLKALSPVQQHGSDTLIGALPLSESPAGVGEGCFSGNSSSSSDDSSTEQYYTAAPTHLPRLGELTHQQQYQQQYGLQQQQQYAGQAVVTAPAAPYTGNTQMRHQRTSESGAAAPWGPQQQQGQTHWQQQQATAVDASWDARSTIGSSSCSSSSNSSSPVRAVKGPASLLLPGRGDVLLQMGPPGAADCCKGSAGAADSRKKRDSWGFAGPAYSTVQGSSQAVAAASILSVVGVAAAGVPLGLQLAAALTADPTNSGHVVPPLVLLGKQCFGWVLECIHAYTGACTRPICMSLLCEAVTRIQNTLHVSRRRHRFFS